MSKDNETDTVTTTPNQENIDKPEVTAVSKQEPMDDNNIANSPTPNIFDGYIKSMKHDTLFQQGSEVARTELPSDKKPLSSFTKRFMDTNKAQQKLFESKTITRNVQKSTNDIVLKSKQYRDVLGLTTTNASLGLLKHAQTNQLSYYRKNLAIGYHTTASLKTLNDSIAVLGNVLESKLEAIKLNTSASDFKKVTFSDRVRDEITRRQVVSVVDMTYGKIRGFVKKRFDNVWYGDKDSKLAIGTKAKNFADTHLNDEVIRNKLKSVKEYVNNKYGSLKKNSDTTANSVKPIPDTVGDSSLNKSGFGNIDKVRKKYTTNSAVSNDNTAPKIIPHTSLIDANTFTQWTRVYNDTNKITHNYLERILSSLTGRHPLRTTQASRTNLENVNDPYTSLVNATKTLNNKKRRIDVVEKQNFNKERQSVPKSKSGGKKPSDFKMNVTPHSILKHLRPSTLKDKAKSISNTLDTPIAQHTKNIWGSKHLDPYRDRIKTTISTHTPDVIKSGANRVNGSSLGRFAKKVTPGGVVSMMPSIGLPYMGVRAIGNRLLYTKEERDAKGGILNSIENWVTKKKTSTKEDASVETSVAQPNTIRTNPTPATDAIHKKKTRFSRRRSRSKPSEYLHDTVKATEVTNDKSNTATPKHHDSDNVSIEPDTKNKSSVGIFRRIRNGVYNGLENSTSGETDTSKKSIGEIVGNRLRNILGVSTTTDKKKPNVYKMDPRAHSFSAEDDRKNIHRDTDRIKRNNDNLSRDYDYHDKDTILKQIGNKASDYLWDTVDQLKDGLFDGEDKPGKKRSRGDTKERSRRSKNSGKISRVDKFRRSSRSIRNPRLVGRKLRGSAPLIRKGFGLLGGIGDKLYDYASMAEAVGKSNSRSAEKGLKSGITQAGISTKRGLTSRAAKNFYNKTGRYLSVGTQKATSGIFNGIKSGVSNTTKVLTGNTARAAYGTIGKGALRGTGKAASFAAPKLLRGAGNFAKWYGNTTLGIWKNTAKLGGKLAWGGTKLAGRGALAAGKGGFNLGLKAGSGITKGLGRGTLALGRGTIAGTKAIPGLALSGLKSVGSFGARNAMSLVRGAAGGLGGLAGAGISGIADDVTDKGSLANRGMHTAGTALQWGSMGAMLGSIVPGVGTVLGGAAGALAGAIYENADVLSKAASYTWKATKTTVDVVTKPLQLAGKAGIYSVKKVGQAASYLYSGIVGSDAKYDYKGNVIKAGKHGLINNISTALFGRNAKRGPDGFPEPPKKGIFEYLTDAIGLTNSNKRMDAESKKFKALKAKDYQLSTYTARQSKSYRDAIASRGTYTGRSYGMNPIGNGEPVSSGPVDFGSAEKDKNYNTILSGLPKNIQEKIAKDNSLKKMVFGISRTVKDPKQAIDLISKHFDEDTSAFKRKVMDNNDTRIASSNDGDRNAQLKQSDNLRRVIMGDDSNSSMGTVASMNQSLGLSGGFRGGVTKSGKNLVRNQEEVIKAMVGLGFSEKAGRAFAANVSGESLANPNDHSGDNGAAQGIVQWRDDYKRVSKIKAAFGKEPYQMSIAEQTKAAVWEMKNNKEYAKTYAMLTNPNATEEQMIQTLVNNYERPTDRAGAVRTRIGFLNGMKAQKVGGNTNTLSANSTISSGSDTDLLTTQGSSNGGSGDGNNGFAGNGTEKACEAADIATLKASNSSSGFCARFVSDALIAAGYKIQKQRSAYMYAQSALGDAGFEKLSNNSKFKKGDIVVFSKTDKHAYGHIQIFNGKQWVSDFRQNNFCPYKDTPPWTLWRDSGKDASSGAIAKSDPTGPSLVSPTSSPNTVVGNNSLSPVNASVSGKGLPSNIDTSSSTSNPSPIFGTTGGGMPTSSPSPSSSTGSASPYQQDFGDIGSGKSGPSEKSVSMKSPIQSLDPSTHQTLLQDSVNKNDSILKNSDKTNALLTQIISAIRDGNKSNAELLSSLSKTNSGSTTNNTNNNVTTTTTNVNNTNNNGGFNNTVRSDLTMRRGGSVTGT